MKACNTDMYHFLQVVAGVDPSFAVLSGEDTLFPLHVGAGARGGIVVTANLSATGLASHLRLAVEGRTAEALAVHRQLIPLMNLAFAETNPGPMKSVLDLIGIDAPAAACAAGVRRQPRCRTRLRAEVERQRLVFEAA